MHPASCEPGHAQERESRSQKVPIPEPTVGNRIGVSSGDKWQSSTSTSTSSSSSSAVLAIVVVLVRS
eukprot:1325960-Rhodomonas_salina.2